MRAKQVEDTEGLISFDNGFLILHAVLSEVIVVVIVHSSDSGHVNFKLPV